MQHIRIHQLLIRLDGVIVNDIPKINCKDSTSSDHCISFEINDENIPLKLSGTFPYFYSQLPFVKELQESKNVFITLDSDDWNPQCESFENNYN